MLDAKLNGARRRIVLDRLLANLSVAGAAFLAGLILLLVLGTRIWDWWVPALLFLLVATAGTLRALLTQPSLERVARTLDERCALADTLATAVHFRGSTFPLAAAQRRQAERAAEKIDIARTIRFAFPRSVYVVAGLGLTASVLLFYRVGTARELSLAAPIAHLNLDALGVAAHADETARQQSSRRPDAANASTRDTNAPDNAMTRLGGANADEAGEKDAPGLLGAAAHSGQPPGKDDSKSTAADGKKAGEAREKASEGSEAGAAPPKPGEQPPSASEGSPQSAQAGSKTSGKPDSTGLMSKLREAVSSLMAKMKPQGNQAPPGQQTAQQPNGKPQSGKPGASQPGKPDAKGNPSDQEGQESASEDSDQMAPGKGAGKSSDQNASAKPGSGMGHQDGSKELRDAEQLSAMGKLSEIIGKRSANVTGEMTIEPQNGPQQLKTDYTYSAARHGAAAGDVNRDRVPVALQGYVRQYFEQVRKQPAAKSQPTASKPIDTKPTAAEPQPGSN